MPPPVYTRDDVHHSPLMCYYEVTRACDLVCLHCRASAQTCAPPGELNGEQARALLAQVKAFPRVPNLVFTGGDPLKRPDLFELIAHASGLGIPVALTPSATPLATADAFRRAREAGVRRIGISLDGADAATHDAFRGWEGSFARTLQMLADAREQGLYVQVNTSVSQRNVGQLDAMAELLARSGIAMWSVFFLVPVGRGMSQARVAAADYEHVFERLWYHAQRQPYAIKTTEAPHYRRYVLQQGGDPLVGRAVAGRGEGRAPLGIGDGKGIVFIGHTGEIYPAGFLPVCCGVAPGDHLVDVYQNHPLFRSLRDPDQLKGKCGKCEYRVVCGGSRSRAYGVTGDALAAEPDCVYQSPGNLPLVGVY